jgi:hypothetical protein
MTARATTHVITTLKCACLDSVGLSAITVLLQAQILSAHHSIRLVVANMEELALIRPAAALLGMSYSVYV